LRAAAVTVFDPRLKELIDAVLEEISFVSKLQDFRVLWFGAPSLAAWQDGTILLTFWCYDEYVSVIG